MNRLCELRNLCLFVALIVFANSIIKGQTPNLSSQSPQSPQAVTIKLNVFIADSQGRPAENVKQEEVQVFEDGILQQVVSVSKPDAPLIYGLVIDNSGSVRTQLESTKRICEAIVRSGKTRDEAFLIRFVDSGNISVVQSFTSDKGAMLVAINKMYTEPGQTALIDAIYLAVQHLVKYKPDDHTSHRALILVTDGEERNSYYKIQTLFDLLRASNIQIFSIALPTAFRDNEAKDRATELLKNLATETGGTAIFPTKKTTFQDVIDATLINLHAQYLVEYKPIRNDKDKTYRKVTVKIIDALGREKLTARTHAGYISQ